MARLLDTEERKEMTNKQINKDRRRLVKGFGTVAATIALPQRLSAQTSSDTDIS